MIDAEMRKLLFETAAQDEAFDEDMRQFDRKLTGQQEGRA